MMEVHHRNLDKRRDQIERLLSRILQQKINIAFATELSLEHRPSLRGFASAGLHDLIREKTPERFVDTRPAFVVMDAVLRTLEPILAAIRFDNVAVHEAAHVLVDAMTSGSCARFHGGELRRLAIAKPTKEPIPWLTHHGRFIRVMLHIAHRAKSGGMLVDLPIAFCGKNYGLSHIKKYAAALGDEPQKKDWQTVAEVVATPMPEKFKKLWTADVLRSVKSVRSRKEQV